MKIHSVLTQVRKLDRDKSRNRVMADLVKMAITLALVGIVSLVLYLCEFLLWKPARLRSKIVKQGITGPPPSFLIGNLGALQKKPTPEVSERPSEGDAPVILSHDNTRTLFPIFEEWRKQYGPIFNFSLGNIQVLYMQRHDVVKEMGTCTSMDFGKPAYLHHELGPLLGKGIITSNGPKWSHQRKILAPELSMEKVKGMTKSMLEASTTLLDSWNNIIDNSKGGVADINIDEHLRSFAGDVISRACFGSNYDKGEEIFLRLRVLIEASAKKMVAIGLPGLRYLPTKSNRETWNLEKEIRSLILKAINERDQSASKNLLQMVLESAANSNLNPSEMDVFIVDNCKNIYLAAYETTAASADWLLMLLAAHPEWQERIRAEVREVCAGRMPDADMVRKMKSLTMALQESLRLYPTTALQVREAMKDMKFGDIHVPKGVSVWTMIIALHQDVDNWGPDAHLFKPERFANGVTGACKFPYMYMPFGVGPRMCLGQNFALTDLKILVALIVSNYSFTLSPQYRHCPVMRMNIEPEYGVILRIKKL